MTTLPVLFREPDIVPREFTLLGAVNPARLPADDDTVVDAELPRRIALHEQLRRGRHLVAFDLEDA